MNGFHIKIYPQQNYKVKKTCPWNLQLHFPVRSLSPPYPATQYFRPMPRQNLLWEKDVINSFLPLYKLLRRLLMGLPFPEKYLFC